MSQLQASACCSLRARFRLCWPIVCWAAPLWLQDCVYALWLEQQVSLVWTYGAGGQEG